MQEIDLLKGTDQPQDELQMVQCEGIIFECSQVVTNVSASGLLAQRTCNVCKGFSHKHENAAMHPSELLPDHEPQRKDLANVMSVT